MITAQLKKLMRTTCGLIVVGFCSSPSNVAASNNLTKTRILANPIQSARAAGMAGALSTLADGIHAPYYNPAGIGGLYVN